MKALRGTPFNFLVKLWHIFNKGKYPFEKDIYALGIVILELLVGEETILKLNATR